jgi:hypothetical protein
VSSAAATQLTVGMQLSEPTEIYVRALGNRHLYVRARFRD